MSIEWPDRKPKNKYYDPRDTASANADASRFDPRIPLGKYNLILRNFYEENGVKVLSMESPYNLLYTFYIKEEGEKPILKRFSTKSSRNFYSNYSASRDISIRIILNKNNNISTDTATKRINMLADIKNLW